MISKAKIKFIHSLNIKKYRDKYQLFIAEGNKLVADMINEFECEWMLAKTTWIATQGNLPVKELILAEENDIQKVSTLKNPQDVIAVFKKPEYSLSEVNLDKELILCLDRIQDPGNIGTIIRIADWFGIENIICSLDTADAFSPKAVQAAMGSLVRVKLFYLNLEEYISKYKGPVYGTFLDGKNIFQEKLTTNGIIVMGNEGGGIHLELEKYVNKKLFIPNYPLTRKTSDSLNVAMATAIVCSEFRRNFF